MLPFQIRFSNCHAEDLVLESVMLGFILVLKHCQSAMQKPRFNHHSVCNAAYGFPRLVIIGWILVTVIFILCGIFIIVHNYLNNSANALDAYAGILAYDVKTGIPLES
ncbi:hypothetical protein QQP08_020308 [Theobroma cacao]|nr:hypothetical protein QQP08_020308 [Theobroma cacao]